LGWVKLLPMDERRCWGNIVPCIIYCGLHEPALVGYWSPSRAMEYSNLTVRAATTSTYKPKSPLIIHTVREPIQVTTYDNHFRLQIGQTAASTGHRILTRHGNDSHSSAWGLISPDRRCAPDSMQCNAILNFAASRFPRQSCPFDGGSR
jgi:hypothetical protein